MSDTTEKQKYAAQRAYEDRQKENGLRRVTVWVRKEDIQHLRDYARELVQAHG